MKKQTAAAFIAAMTITTLTACGGPKQLSKSVTVELGKEDGIKVTDILDVSKDKAKDVKVDTKKVNFYKEGKYDATLTYDKKEYKVTVKIKDTVAPEATAKESITVQTGTAVHVTDCLDKVTEASGNIKAEFETKPEADNAQGTETTESTEKADKSSASSSESTESTEATDTQSQTIAVGDVNLSSNDEITYVTAGDYDNNIVVTDNAGNETKVPVKISVINAPTINGVTDKTITVGDTIDYMAGVTATDGKGADITSSVQVDSSAVNTGAAGTYQVAYKVTDANGYIGSATSNVTVNENQRKNLNRRLLTIVAQVISLIARRIAAHQRSTIVHQTMVDRARQMVVEVHQVAVVHLVTLTMAAVHHQTEATVAILYLQTELMYRLDGNWWKLVANMLQ